jgi:hypothetical protein
MDLLKIIIVGICIINAVACSYTHKDHPKQWSYLCKRATFQEIKLTEHRSTYIRSTSNKNSEISIRTECAPDPDPIYTPRGPLKEIAIKEGSHEVIVSEAILQSLKETRGLDDLWPEYIELSSEKPGEYTLWLPCGVPAGLAAVIVEINKFKLSSAYRWLDPHFVQDQKRRFDGAKRKTQFY